jgi:hypothetical protein
VPLLGRAVELGERDTGRSRSLAISFRPREIDDTSCRRLSSLRPVVISWR